MGGVGKAVPRQAGIDQQHILPRAGKLHCRRLAGKAAADHDHVMHGSSFQWLRRITILDKLHNRASRICNN